MTDIVQEHFSKIDEPDLYFDGKHYIVKGEPSKEIFPNIHYGLTEDEMKKGHHINYYTFRKFFEMLKSIENPLILETGSSAWGVNSSTLFDNYINRYGGEFHTVDLHPYTTQKVRQTLSPLSTAHNGDSVNFLLNFKNTRPVDAVYLDSYDMDWLNYEPSAQHGKKEMEAVLPLLNKRSLILIDDTPLTPFFLPSRGEGQTQVQELYDIINTMPGKGMYAEDVLKANSDKFKYKKILHMYAVIFEVERV